MSTQDASPQPSMETGRNVPPGIAFRLARREDIPALHMLIPLSAQALQSRYYSPAQLAGAIGTVFGVDSQIIDDGTYFVATVDGRIVGCGGWSQRKTQFGADSAKKVADTLRDPAKEPAMIRAFFVHPDFARRGIGREFIRRSEIAAAEAGFTSIEIVATLAGEPLYGACGYIAVERFETNLINGEKMPLVRMKRERRLLPRNAATSLEPTPHAKNDEFPLQPRLTGSLVDLRPLRESDFEAVYAVASDPLIWAQHPNPERCQREVFVGFFRDAIASGGAFTVMDRRTGQVIGCTRFLKYAPEKSQIEIGYTFLARSHWGGKYNGEMKRLMIEHAFRHVRKVVFVIGPNNIRSQKAVERIGAMRDSTTVSADGHPRVVYSITADGVKVG